MGLCLILIVRFLSFCTRGGMTDAINDLGVDLCLVHKQINVAVCPF